MKKSATTNKILFFLLGFAFVAGTFLFLSFALPKPANAIPIVGECDPAGSCCGCGSKCSQSESCVATSTQCKCAPPPTNPPPPNPTIAGTQAPPPPPPGGCTNPASCGNGGECCSGFDCCVDASLGCTVGKCVPSSNCIPNKYDCRQSSCVAVCGRNCNDCTGCDPTQGTGDCCPGGGTSCCCKDGCNPSDANACLGGGGEDPTPPPQACGATGCGIGGRFTVNGTIPTSYGFYGWYNDGTQYSYYQKAIADGTWHKDLACGVQAFGGARIDDSDKQNYSKNPAGSYAYNVSNLQTCITNWNFTLTAPTPTPEVRGRIRNYVFYDKNLNARPNNMPLTDKYLAGLTLSLKRANRAAFSDTCTSNSTAQYPSGNCGFGMNLFQNDYYVSFNVNGLAGYKLATCDSLNKNQSELPDSIYIYCLNGSGSPVLRRYAVGNCGDPFCPVQYVNLNTTEVHIMYPFTFLATPTPTRTPTPTPTNTPTPTPTLANLPWFKLKDTSFSRVGSLTNKIPAVPQSFDSDDPAPVLRQLELNQGGIVSAGSITLSDSAPYPKTSTNDWKITSYNPSAGFSIANFVSYVKSRKEYKKITNLATELKPDALYITEGNKTVSNPDAANGPYVLIVDGNLTLNSSPFNPSGAKNIAFIVTGTLTIPPGMSELNGLFIANNVDLGTSSTKLKVNGNLISQTPISITRSNGVGNFAPALFIKFDSKYYTALLPYLTTATYEWRQLQ